MKLCYLQKNPDSSFSKTSVVCSLSHAESGGQKNTMDNMEVGQERVSIVNKKG